VDSRRVSSDLLEGFVSSAAYWPHVRTGAWPLPRPMGRQCHLTASSRKLSITQTTHVETTHVDDNCRCAQLIEHGLTSAPTQYRLYGRPFLQV